MAREPELVPAWSARLCSALQTWPRLVRRARNPGNRKGVPRTRPGGRDRVHSEDIFQSRSAGPLDRDPFVDPPLIRVVMHTAKSFHCLPAAATPGGRADMFFRYKALKDCLARCSSTLR